MKTFSFCLLFFLSVYTLVAQINPDKKHTATEHPCPTVTIGGTVLDGDSMNKNFLMASALIPIMKGSGPDIFYTVKTFKAITIRAQGQSKDFSVSGNHLTAELKNEINSLSSGDKIKFYDIEIKEPGSNSTKSFCRALPVIVTIK